MCRGFISKRTSTASVHGNLDPLLRDGQAELELRNRRKSGEECYIRLSLSLLRDEANQPYAMLGVAIDITAQKQAERALRESEDRYRSLADAMPQVAYITGADGKTKLINHHWAEYAGVSNSECLDLDWLAWVHPDDAPPLLARWKECVRTGDRFELEYRLRNAKGEYCWHLGRAVPVRDPHGKITGWVGTSTEIHALKSAEAALKTSEERLRLASLSLDGIVYDWFPQTGVVNRSGDLAKIIGNGLTEAEPTEQWWQERVHPDDAANSSLNVLRRLGKDQSSFETEFRIRHADGHWVDICDRGYIVRDENGTPVRVVGTTQDISARKLLERAILESNARLRFQADILATTNDAVIAIDSNQLVTYLSPGAERLYGVESSEVLGKPLSAIYQYEWLNPEDEKRAVSDLAERGTWKGENRHTRRDGTQLIVSSTVNVLSQESGGGLVG